MRQLPKKAAQSEVEVTEGASSSEAPMRQKPRPMPRASAKPNRSRSRFCHSAESAIPNAETLTFGLLA